MTALNFGAATAATGQLAEQWPAPAVPEPVGSDPFFDAPAGFEESAEGTLLRYRDITIGFLGRIKQRVRATQLLYRSTNLRGEPEVTATTVVTRAKGAAPGAPLVSYQCAIDSLAPDTFPSYVLQHGAQARGTSFPQIEWVFIAAAVARGWAVSIPDHGGQPGRWGIPREPGYMVLDGLRACLQYEPLGLASDTRVGVWGYSGGGLATAWAAEMQPTYAPEINLVAGAMGAPVSDPGSTFVYLNETLFTGLPTLVIAALAREYPSLQKVLADHVDEKGRKVFYEDAPRWTPEQAIRRMAHKDLAYYADRPFPEMAQLPALLELFDDIRPGQQVPSVPMLVVQSTRDQIVPVADATAHVGRYATGGTHVTYVTDDWSDHFSLHFLSAPMLFGWLADRLDGRPVTPAGHRPRKTIMASGAQLARTARLFGVAARVCLGRGL
ncbi:lipase family protein [Tsukamurella sp. 8F]|uniref:lipase family protein n=1 Tax=Tsukamurella sp. 8F TaxID=3031961 RepID=UPI0023B8F6BC|nr:lipase family protein [Tsukamurella sp. 8F]MDF0587188.1 lipase family protein [Tsukamurella sp. 8F]